MPTFLERIKARRFNSASSSAVSIGVNGESESRLDVDAGGKLLWGSGSATGDTNLYRSAANTLKSDDAFTAASLAVTSQFTLPTSDGTADQVMVTNGSGTITWADQSGGGTPGGSDGQVQYNNGGVFGGASSLVYDDVNSRVGIGTASPADPLHVVGDVTIEFSDDGSLAQPEVTLQRNSTTPDNGDYLGQIKFAGKNDAGQTVNYAKITGKISDVTDTTEDGLIEVAMITGGSQSIGYRLTSTDLKLINGVGLQVDGDVGIGTTSPGEPLDIATASGSAYVRQGNGTATTYLGPDSANTGLFGTSTSHDVRFITGNTERVRIDTSGNVGVGTQSPARGPLHLHTPSTAATELHLTNTESGSTSGDGFTLFYDDATNGAGLWMREAGPLRFATSGSERVRIDSSGNVGIGTESPATALDVRGTTDVHGNINMQQSGASSSINWHDTLDGTFWHMSGPRTSNDHLNIYWNNGSTYALNTSFTNEGKVGIGTESPVAGLDIATTAGDTWTSNGWDSGIILNAASALRWRTGTGVDWGMGNSGSNFYIMSSTSSTTGAPADYRMFIGSTGLVGVGTTSPGANLDVKRTGTGAWQRGIRVLNADMVNGNELMIATGRADSARNMGQMYFAYTSSGSTSNRLSFGLHSADDVLNITGASRVGIGTTAPSDTLHVNGTFRAPGNVVAMYEFHDNVANRSINSNTTLYTQTITTQGNTRLIMQFVTGQFIKSTSVTNLNIRWSMDGFYLTAGDQYLETQHIGYGANNFREQLVTTANTGTLSAGNHTLRVFAESYGNHTVTLNYQGAARSSHVYVWEVCV